MLAEGSYFRGVAAMANSLVRNGFAGHIVVGYRGALPHWDGPVTPRPGPAQTVAPGVDIRFLPVEGDWHLGNLKPHFLRRVAAELHPVYASLWYFDADIVAEDRLGRLRPLVGGGAGPGAGSSRRRSCPPPTPSAASGAPWPSAPGSATGTSPATSTAAASACRRRQLGFLQAWETLLEAHAATGADMGRMVNRTGKPEYAKMDQDLLNAAVMATDTPYCVLGVEAMDAFPSANVMSHAMVFAKPWLRNYIRDAIIGFQPDPAHKAFWLYADGADPRIHAGRVAAQDAGPAGDEAARLLQAPHACGTGECRRLRPTASDGRDTPLSWPACR